MFRKRAYLQKLVVHVSPRTLFGSLGVKWSPVQIRFAAGAMFLIIRRFGGKWLY